VEAYNIYGTSPVSTASLPTIIMRDPAIPVNLRENLGFRSFTTLSFDWDDGHSNFGSPIIDYTVSVSIGDSSTDFNILSSIVLLKNYIAPGLTVGEIYNFKVQARNQHGISDESDIFTMTCAFVPSQPQAPTTSVVLDTIKVDWIEPFNGGIAITAYKILIRTTAGGVYTEDLVDCDGSDGGIVIDTECFIPFTTLRVAPFSLSQGATVDAKIIAINFYGESTPSEIGGGANIVGVPEAPVNLQNT
jgi:hypothetical protein